MRWFPLLQRLLPVVLVVGVLSGPANASNEKEIYLKVITVFTPEEEIRNEVLSFLRASLPEFVVSEIPSSSALWLFVDFKENQRRSPEDKYKFLVSYKISLRIDSYKDWRFVTEGSCQEGVYERTWRMALRGLLKAFKAKWMSTGGKISARQGTPWGFNKAFSRKALHRPDISWPPDTFPASFG